ncbi:DUF308 domain-containing protein [Actinoplanes sp. NPDC048967]|uniref:DUF308 domain-containing protein n=1 Tax=Actinoplanes sp. NPDC048967 TaxID=3155269 RepID=UPI0034062C0C
MGYRDGRAEPTGRTSHGMRMATGVLLFGAGASALAWPSATVRVLGLLFGLNLVVTGPIRAGLLLVVPGYPRLYRIAGIVGGVLTTIAGLICLRSIAVSVVLLIVVVTAGGALNALLGTLLSTDGAAESRSNRYVVAGSVLLVAAGVGLIRPELEPATLARFGGAVLLCAGTAQLIRSIAGWRVAYRAQV